MDYARETDYHYTGFDITTLGPGTVEVLVVAGGGGGSSSYPPYGSGGPGIVIIAYPS